MASATVSYLLTARKESDSPQFEFQYPSTTGESDDLLLERVFPSVAKEEDFSIFHLGRRLEMEITKRSKRTPTIIDPQELEVKAVELYVYELNEEGENGAEWEMIGEDLMVALLEPNTIQLVDDSDQTEIASIAPHFDLEFTELEECFACVLLETGMVLGLRFQNVEDEMIFMLKVEEMCQKVAKSKQAKTAESGIARYIGSQLTCLSVIRGNVALCMCSPIEYLYPFKHFLEQVIENYEKEPTEETLKVIFSTLNLITIPTELPASVDVSLFEKKITLKFTKPTIADQIFPSNFSFLFRRFKESTAHIYDSVIAEKRVIFVGTESSQELCDCVLSSCLLIAPVFGITKESSFPITSTNCRFQHSLKYIAGVSEKEIVNQPQHWDLLCNIDEGTVQWNTSSVDATFIAESEAHEPFFHMVTGKAIIGKGEPSIRKVLLQYTRRFIDSVVGRGFFQSAEEATAYHQNIKRKTLFWSASKACERWESKMEARALKDYSVDKVIQQFAFAKSLPDDVILDLFSKIRSAASGPERTNEIRCIMSDYNCVEKFGCAMLHSSAKVRDAAKFFLFHMKLLAKNDEELNPVLRMVHQRLNQVRNE